MNAKKKKIKKSTWYDVVFVCKSLPPQRCPALSTLKAPIVPRRWPPPVE